MAYAISKRSSCSVCGIDTFRRTGWFLVVENRWLDRLKILSWIPHPRSWQRLLIYKETPDGLRNHKTLVLFGLWHRHLSPHRMVPGGREPLARPHQDPLLAFLDRLAERHEERLLPAASQNARSEEH